MIRKLLYLLQLEEYQTDRYWRWLRNHSIEKLEERKKRLVFTGRIKILWILSAIFSLFLDKKIAVARANQVVAPIFSLMKKILILRAKIKLKNRPDLIRILVTGSYGKTTFKEMLSWVLKAKFRVLKTPENINTEIGIAQTINSRLKKKHQILIVEAGAYSPGEIKRICQLVQPDFGIITIIGLMHLERFGTQEMIRKTKLEVVPFIKNRNRLFIPAQDNQMINFNQTVKKIAYQLGLDPNVINRRLKSFSPPAHRLEEKRIGPQIILLDDSYNANPLGAQRALKKLASYKNHQKIIITPGMIEFGAKQFEVNQQLGQKAAEVADILIFVGQTNRRALLTGAKKARKRKKIICLESNQNWDQLLPQLIRPPTVILLENDLPDHYF